MPSKYHDLTDQALTNLVGANPLVTSTNSQLAPWFPAVQTSNIRYKLERLGRRGIDIAAYRARNTPSKIIDRQKAGSVTAREIPPLSAKLAQSEEDLAEYRNLADASEATRAAFGDDAALTAASVMARIWIAQRDVMIDAEVSFAHEDGFDGVTIDYNRSGTFEVTADTVWTDASNADIIDEVESWHATYKATNGPAAAILVSEATYANILKNDQVRSYTSYTGSQSGPLIPSVLTQYMTARGLPPFAVIDTRIEQIDGGTTYLWPDTKAVFVPQPGSGYGATVWTPPVLPAGVQVSGGEYGMATYSFDVDEPVATWTKSVAYAVPATGNPDATMVATVSA